MEQPPWVFIAERDLHPHLKARMAQRGVTPDEIARTVNEGRQAKDAKSGTVGKVLVFPYNAEWEGCRYEKKKVTVYYRVVGERVVVLTVKARYGREFISE